MAKPFPLWRARRLRHLQPLSEHRLANLHFDRGRSHPGAFSVGDRDFIGVGAARQHVPPIELLIEHDVATAPEATNKDFFSDEVARTAVTQPERELAVLESHLLENRLRCGTRRREKDG